MQRDEKSSGETIRPDPEYGQSKASTGFNSQLVIGVGELRGFSLLCQRTEAFIDEAEIGLTGLGAPEEGSAGAPRGPSCEKAALAEENRVTVKGIVLPEGLCGVNCM